MSKIDLTPEEQAKVKSIGRMATWSLIFVSAIGLFIFYNFYQRNNPYIERSPTVSEKPATPVDSVVDGMDVQSGLIAAEGYHLVKQHCTGCHSSKLIIQNRQTREGWIDLIRWMQDTQKLWDLGKSEGPILDYLSTHYAPEWHGRRKPLQEPEWYTLEQ